MMLEHRDAIPRVSPRIKARTPGVTIVERYARDVIGILRQYQAHWLPELLRMYEEDLASSPVPTDALGNRADGSPRILRVLQLLEFALFGSMNLYSAERMVRHFRRFSTMRSERLAGLIGRDRYQMTDVDEILQMAVRSNLEKMKGVSSLWVDETSQVLVQSFRTGELTNDVAKAINRRAEIAQGRAKFVARNEMATLSGVLDEHNQTTNGVTHYRWVTSLDERVRESHQPLHGQVFDWNYPPDVGHPGHDFNCRCIADPIIDFD